MSMGLLDYILLALIGVAFIYAMTKVLDYLYTDMAKEKELKSINDELHARIDAQQRVEQLLKESESQYRALVERANDGIVIVQDLAVVYANPRVSEMVGLSIAESLGKPIASFIYPEEISKIETYYQKRFNNEAVPTKYETALKSKDGLRVDVEVNASLITYNGQPAELVIIRDIADRKLAEKQLASTAAQYQILVQTIPDIIYEVNTQGLFIFVSDAVRQLGYEPVELLGVHFSKIIYAEDVEQVSREIVLPQYKGKVTGDSGSPELADERRTGARMTRNLEVRVLTKKPMESGQDYCYMEVHSCGKWDKDVSDANKQLLGSIGIMRDVTARKTAENELEYRLEFERIITLLSAHFINAQLEEMDITIKQTLQAVGEFLGVDRAYLYINSENKQQVSNIFEWCAEGVNSLADLAKVRVGAMYPWLTKKMQDQEAVYVSALADLPKEADKQKFYCAKNGIRSFAIVPLVFSGRTIGLLGLDSQDAQKNWPPDSISLLKMVAELFANVLMRKADQEALQSANTKLKETQYQLFEAEKMDIVGRLASGVAHEVKNPLATILMGVDYILLKLKLPEESINSTLVDIKEAVKRADTIIKGLLDFSSLSKLDRSQQDINVLIERALLLLKHQFDRAHISALRELSATPLIVPIDKNRIEQVLVNLVMNALQATPEGGSVTVRSYATKLVEQPKDFIAQPEEAYFLPGDQLVVVEIEDTGVGIPENLLSKIFDPFFTTKRDKGGTGLGLSIVRNLVEMHRAKIEINNRGKVKGVRVRIVFKAEDVKKIEQAS